MGCLMGLKGFLHKLLFSDYERMYEDLYVRYQVLKVNSGSKIQDLKVNNYQLRMRLKKYENKKSS